MLMSKLQGNQNKMLYLTFKLQKYKIYSIVYCILSFPTFRYLKIILTCKIFSIVYQIKKKVGYEKKQMFKFFLFVLKIAILCGF